MILDPAVVLNNPPLRPDRDSVREGDPAQGVNNPDLKPHTLSPEISAQLRPINKIFQVQTYTLVANETHSFIMDAGADTFYIYMNTGTADKQLLICLGSVIQADLAFRFNVPINTRSALLTLPAQSQFLTIQNLLAASYSVTVVAAKNCTMAFN